MRSWISRFTSLSVRVDAAPRGPNRATAADRASVMPIMIRMTRSGQIVRVPVFRQIRSRGEQVMVESRAAVQRFHDNHYRYAHEPFIRGFGITRTVSY